MISTEEEKVMVTECINSSLNCFFVAYELLLELGYTKEELAKVKTTAAWDLMRTSMVARTTYNLTYISIQKMWSYMDIAEQHTTKLYSSWRECVATFIFGRALGYHADSIAHKDTLNFLLKDEKSPYNTIKF